MRMFQAFLAIHTAVACVQANFEVLNIFRPDTARAVLYLFYVCNFVINLAATDRRQDIVRQRKCRTSNVIESVS